MISLRDREWAEFKLSSIFSIASTSSNIDKVKLNYQPGEFPYVTRSANNNGINDFVCRQAPFSLDGGNCITVGCDTQTAFYQCYPFYTGNNVQILRNEHLNSTNAKFVLPLLKNLMTVFSWGSHGATLTRLRRRLILLPTNENGEPDWLFMEDYIREREQVILQKYIAFAEDYTSVTTDLIPLTEKEWVAFPIADIFTIKPGKRLTKSDMKDGLRPFVGATEANNGITHFVSNSNASLDSNVLGVNYNGSVVETFYHPYKCIFSDDVKRFSLKHRQGNRLIYLFLKIAIVQQKSKYAYGYKFNEQRMNKQSILLPIVDARQHNPEPDWDYMEQYVKAIMCRQMASYLTLKRA